MSILGSDGLRLLVGDGAVPENFTALRGLEVQRFQIGQTLVDSDALQAHGWSMGLATVNRRGTIEATALASSYAAALRLRELAMLGAAGNFRLEIVASTLHFHMSGFVTNYTEVMQPGAIKRIQFRMESSAAITAA